MLKVSLRANISQLEIGERIEHILNENHIYNVEELWKLKRQDLKKMKLLDSEIMQIIIKLQLRGIDLNGKIYK